MTSPKYDLVCEAEKHFARAQEVYEYGFGMDTLYRMCRREPSHHDVGRVISKLWLIGRSHAAALERRRDTQEYVRPYQRTARALVNSEYDVLLEHIRQAAPKYGPVHLAAVESAVLCVAQVLQRTTGMWKPSLASKYTHFHEPSAPILDSIALGGLRTFIQRRELTADERALWDRGGYSRFLARFSAARRRLREGGLDPVTARTMDTFLLYWAG